MGMSAAERQARHMVRKKPARSSVTVPDPTADEGFREVVSASADR
jgi:hypothetical protein